MTATAPIHQPFINHFADLLGKRKGMDEALKAGINISSFAEWALLLSETTERASVYCAQASMGLGLARTVIKMADLLDDAVTLSDAFFPPEELSMESIFWCNLLEGAGFGGSDILNIPVFLDQMGLAEFEEWGDIIVHVGKSCSLVGLGALAFKSATEIDLASVKLQHCKDRLEILMQNPRSEANTLDMGNQLAITYLEKCIIKHQAKVQQSAWALAQAIVDIAAVIFGFACDCFSIPLIAATPVLSLLGIGSAYTGLQKLWIDSSIPS